MWTATLVAGAAGAILTLGVLSAVGAIGRPSEATNGNEAVPTSAPIRNAIANAPVLDATAIAMSVGPSVVAVSVRDAAGTRRGSGVCIRRSHGTVTTAKEVLTSDRLIGASTSVEVTTADGVVHTAHIVGRDATSDLVLLRLDAAIPAAESAQSPSRPGDDVWVVGASKPGGTSPWMSKVTLASTEGLVSVSSGPTTSGLLEAGAASNPATAGGALVDGTGDVAGILLSPVGNGGMTYAVPIETALAIAADLRSLGYARHGALGIDGTDAPEGPVVTGVVPEGPADRAGIEAGDVVESVDEHEVETMEEVMAHIRHDSPGTAIVLEIRRGTQQLAVTATLGTMGPR
jgi:S1-C subfamily serine protease